MKYKEFVSKCRKEGKSMKECAIEWKAMKQREGFPMKEVPVKPIDAKDIPGEQVSPAKDSMILQNLQKDMQDLKEKNEMLLQIADKRMLSQYYSRHAEKLPTMVKLRMIDDKVIVGWKTVEDKVYKEPVSMRWIETQKIKVLYEDETVEEFHLMDYVNRYTFAEAKVLSKQIDEVTGNIALKVARIDNGKEYQIGVAFIN